MPSIENRGASFVVDGQPITDQQSRTPPLVDYERHYGVRLSRAGKKRALEIIRHHRLIETFLYEVLNYPINEIHDEAERLEHFISESFEKRIAENSENRSRTRIGIASRLSMVLCLRFTE